MHEGKASRDEEVIEHLHPLDMVEACLQRASK